MIVKICGITSVVDAHLAVESGADILGYNFFERSARFLPPERCRSIQHALRESGVDIQTAGIFVNSSADEIQETLNYCELDIAQISGDEPKELIDSLSGRLLRSIRLRNLSKAYAVIEAYSSRSDIRFLVDSYQTGSYGGTGEVGNWSAAAKIASRYPILLAGGLSPENVEEAIDIVKPWGVDVASGVESTPGVKDPIKMQKFVETAKKKWPKDKLSSDIREELY